MKKCARCSTDLSNRKEIGISSLYSPDEEFELCMPCFEWEDKYIEQTGTNDHSDIIKEYKL